MHRLKTQKLQLRFTLIPGAKPTRPSYLRNILLLFQLKSGQRCGKSASPRGARELLVAVSNGVVHGWINFSASRDEDATPTGGEIWAIYVSPASRSSDTGRRLWSHASERMRSQGFHSCSLWVLPQNTRAIRFYEAAGFALDTIAPKSFHLGGLELQEVRYVCHLNAETLSWTHRGMCRQRRIV